MVGLNVNPWQEKHSWLGLSIHTYLATCLEYCNFFAQGLLQNQHPRQRQRGPQGLGTCGWQVKWTLECLMSLLIAVNFSRKKSMMLNTIELPVLLT